ncbi:ribonuclease H-like domain-containing protein [Tanacetum coccineum]
MDILINSFNQSNLLHLHVNDSNGIPLIGGLPVPEYYHKLNSPWREFDILTKLPDCTCEARAELLDHGKVLKLMEKVLGTGSEYAGLFLFDTDCVKFAMCNNRSLNLSNIDHNSPCEVRHKAKQTRESFPLNEHKSTCFGELIHLDSKPETKTFTLRPNDDEEGSSGRDGRVHQLVIGSDIDQPGYDDTHPITPIGEQNTSEGNVGSDNEIHEVPIFQNVLPNVTGEGGLRIFANHYVLSAEKCWFVSNLNKFVEPSSFEEAANDVVLIFRIKYKSLGEIERYKVRLVAKGFSQKEDINYAETFSLVVKMGTVRCLRSLVVQNGWKFFQLGVNNAFLYGDLNEEVYMVPPPGFCKDGDNKVHYMHASLKSHLDMPLRVLKYLKLAPDLGVEFLKRKGIFDVVSYSHSDWSKCQVTRKSVLGYCVFVNGNLVSWKSKKQATLSKSSDKAEYRAMASATCEVMWIIKILKDFNIDNVIPASLFCDNKSAIQIAANPVMHEKTKHFDIDVHLVREKIAPGLIKTVKLESKNQIANILTKALGTFQHPFMVRKLGLLNMFAS